MTYRSGTLFGLTLLLSLGCGENAASPVTLSDSDQTAAHGWLREHFTAIHDHEFIPPEGLNDYLDTALQALTARFDPVPEPIVLWLNNPDADLGCIAGHQIFLTIGLMAFVEHPDELHAALALALTACQQADRLWAERDRNRLPEIDEANPLMVLYRDYRLEQLAALYGQLVQHGCGLHNDCQHRAQAWLTEDSVDAHALDRLLARIGKAWSDAAVIYRFDGFHEVSAAIEADPEFSAVVAPYLRQRAMLDHIRHARQELLTGVLLDAYRANFPAYADNLGSWLPALMQARLDLANFHPEYTQRELRALRGTYTDTPTIALYRGIGQWQRNRLPEAIRNLESSVEQRPTISGHYYLGLIFAHQGHTEPAMRHFRTALEGGPVHPYAREAQTRLSALEDATQPGD